MKHHPEYAALIQEQAELAGQYRMPTIDYLAELDPSDIALCLREDADCIEAAAEVFGEVLDHPEQLAAAFETSLDDFFDALKAKVRAKTIERARRQVWRDVNSYLLDEETA